MSQIDEDSRFAEFIRVHGEKLDRDLKVGEEYWKKLLDQTAKNEQSKIGDGLDPSQAGANEYYNQGTYPNAIEYAQWNQPDSFSC